MMDPADLYDDDPGITSWAGVSYAVAEMRAALAAAEARAERAEARVEIVQALCDRVDESVLLALPRKIPRVVSVAELRRMLGAL